MKRNLYKGFTLAETLIALSVVGIIAMMTLPSLITNHNENILNKASELFQARVKDAMNVMWQTGKLEGILSTEEFVEELEKNMNLANKCSNSNLTNCFVETINTDNNPIETSTLKKSSHFGHKDYDTTTMGLRTNFGVNAIIAFDKYCEIPADAKEIPETWDQCGTAVKKSKKIHISVRTRILPVHESRLWSSRNFIKQSPDRT